MVGAATNRAIVSIVFEEAIGDLILNDYASELPVWGIVKSVGKNSIGVDGAQTTMPYMTLKEGDTVLFYYAAALNNNTYLLSRGLLSVRLCDIVAYKRDDAVYTMNGIILMTREHYVDSEEASIPITKGDRVTHVPARNYPVYKVVATPEYKHSYDLTEYKQVTIWMEAGDIVIVDPRQTIRLNPQGQHTPINGPQVMVVIDQKYVYAKE
jgi:co-chaperonin GroES (HSP10)